MRCSYKPQLVVISDGLDGLLEPGVLAYVPKPTMGAAVGCERLFSALLCAFAGGFGRCQRVLHFACWALHGSCPIDAQHPQHKGQGDGDKPQDEGDKNVHASLLNSMAHTQGLASQLHGPLICSHMSR